MWQTSQLPARLLGLLLAGAFSVGFGFGCIVDDPLYCGTADDCVRISGGATNMECHPTKHFCVDPITSSCDDDSDCLSDTNSRCDRATSVCQPCRPDNASDTSCAHLPKTPLCGKSSTGVAQCVGCRSHLDCSKESPICDSVSQTCRKCKKHSDCEGTLKCDDGNECIDSMVCLGRGDLDDVETGLDGRCAQNGDLKPGRVVYVNGGQAICPDGIGTRTGTSYANAFCTLKQGLDAAVANQRRFIRVIDTPGKTYLPLTDTIESGRYVFIGAPGKAVTTRAVVGTRAPTFKTQKTANVTLDSLDIRAENDQVATLVECRSNSLTVPTMWIRDSVFRGMVTSGTAAALDTAVKGVDCNLRITGTLFGVDSLSRARTDPSLHVAVTYERGSLTDVPTLVVENCVMAGLISSAMRLEKIGNTKTTLRFLTFAANGRTGNIGGSYGAYEKVNAPLLSYSVFYDITPDGAKSIFPYFPAGMLFNWRYQKLVIPTGLSDMDPEITPAAIELEDDYSLKASSTVNRNTCIDQVQAGADLPTTDFRGNPRPMPKDGKWDLGAFEVQ